MGTKAFEVYGEMDLKGDGDVKRKLDGATEAAKGSSTAMTMLKGAVAGIGLGAMAREAWDSVEAFAESETYSIRLQRSIEATGTSYEKVEQQVEDTTLAMMMQGAYTDEQLNGSLARLVQTTGDLTSAQNLLAIAMDVSRGTGKPLEDTAVMIGKVYSGNIGALRRYGISLDGITTSTQALAELQKRYAGQAEAYGDNVAGSIEKAKIAVDELKEAFGEGLVAGISGGADDAGESLLQLTDEVKLLGEGIMWVARITPMGLGLQLKSWVDGTDKAAEASDKAASATEDLTLAQDDAAESVKDATVAQIEYTTALNGTKVAKDSLAGIQRTIAELENASEKATWAAQDALTKYNEEVKEHGKDSREAAEAWNEYETASWNANDAQNAVNDAINDFRANGANAANDPALLNLLTQIRDRAAQAAAKMYLLGQNTVAATILRGGEMEEYFSKRGYVATYHDGGGVPNSGMYSLRAGEHVLRESQVERIIEQGAGGPQVVVVADPRYTDMDKLDADVARANSGEVSFGSILGLMGM